MGMRPSRWLSGLIQVLPLAFDRLQLVDSTFFGIKVILAVRHSSRTLQLHRTLGPFGRARTFALWPLIFNDSYAIANRIRYAGCP